MLFLASFTSGGGGQSEQCCFESPSTLAAAVLVQMPDECGLIAAAAKFSTVPSPVSILSRQTSSLEAEQVVPAAHLSVPELMAQLIALRAQRTQAPAAAAAAAHH